MNFELNQDWLKGDLPGLQEADWLNNKRIHSNQSNIQAMSINKGHGSSVGPVFADSIVFVAIHLISRCTHNNANDRNRH